MIESSGPTALALTIGVSTVGVMVRLIVAIAVAFRTSMPAPLPVLGSPTWPCSVVMAVAVKVTVPEK